MIKIASLFAFLYISSASADECRDWFLDLKIKDLSSCPMKCKIAKVGMSSFMCRQKCDSFCSDLRSKEDPENFYGLTEDELKFCENNKVICLNAYKLSWKAENLCSKIYPKSQTNDESDACRHYTWAILLSAQIDPKTAETILNAHENNPKEPEDEKAMDLANNRLGLLHYQSPTGERLSDAEIIESFKDQMTKKKLIILRPQYPKTGGLP